MFDYLENIQIVVMILNFPDIYIAQVILSSAFAIAKSVLKTLFIVLLLFAIIKLWVGATSVKTQ